MDAVIKEILDPEAKRSLAREVLDDLPEWFGIPESTEAYIRDAQNKPFLACFIGHQVAGFIVLNASSQDCAEVFVMGVKKQYQRMGLGAKLHQAFEEQAKTYGYTFA